MADDDLDGDNSESWLGEIEGGLFEEETEQVERRRAATAFAAKRRDMGWRLTHNELYDRAGQGLIETAMGPVNFDRGQGQQGRAWDCSLVLAKYLERRPEEVRGKGVLELGCGLGLPGVAAAVMGAKEVILTDMAVGLPAIRRTIELNPAVADRLTGQVLGWGDEPAAALLLARARCPISVILCSDLLYGDGAGEKGGGAAEALAASLDAVCVTRGTLVLSCHERRWAGDKGAFFFETMARKGFSVEAVDVGGVDERYEGDSGISLTRLRKTEEEEGGL